jgi:hypothetical protein
MEGITRFLTTKLKLKVNRAKSAVAQPKDRKFLGFSFTGGKQPRRRIASKAILRLKARIRELTCRTCADGEATSASVRRPRYWKALLSGSGADCGLRSGSSGSVGASGLRNFTNGALDVTLLPKRRVVHMALGRSLTALPKAYFDSLGIPRLAVR